MYRIKKLRIMKTINYKISEGAVTVFVEETQIATMSINTVEDTENNRFLSLIENVDVETEYQHKGIYSEMLKLYAEANFAENQYFCSIGRSEEACNFWAKKLDVSERRVELGIEKDEQDNALIINADLSLNNIEEVRSLINLFW